LKSKLAYDPFPLIFEQGDAATKLTCLALFTLAGSPQASASLLALLRKQRADGAFPSQFDAAKPGTRETGRTALLLLEAGMPADGVNVASAGRFLLSCQRPDGSWSEGPELEIPAWVVEVSNGTGVTWLTADVIDLLRRLRMAENDACQSALRWLRQVQNEHGGWHCFRGSTGYQRGTPGDPDSTAQIAFMMGEVYGEDDPGYLAGRALYEQFLDECARDVERGYRIRQRDGQRVPLDAYTLTQPLLAWALEPPRRVDAGYSARDRRVRGIMDALIQIQREDGGWRPFWSDASSPQYTVIAVRALILSGMLCREDMAAQAERHAWAPGR
jgi:hypothetical protein